MNIIFISLVVTLVLNFLLFLVAFRQQSDKLTDFAYSLSFIAVTTYTLFAASHLSFPVILLSAMVYIWALRLGAFLVYRIRKSGRDARFDDIRGNAIKFLKFWLGQGLVAWFLLLPLMLVATREATITPSLWIGAALWLVGFVVESVADLQKYRFNQIADNKGQWIDQGIWHYSRHPNYFGEICVWIGVYIAAFANLSILEQIISVVSPAAITISLLFISGVPILERSADMRWGERKAYREYKRRTSILIPLWRKK